MRRQHALDLRQRSVGRAAELGVAPVLHHARAEDERLALAEHQWRQVVALAQRVSDSRRALNRNLACDQIADIAVDRALADLEVFGERTGGDDAAPAEPLYDLEQAIGATHDAPSPVLSL